MAVDLPDLKPAQIPSVVRTDADLHRWKLCVGITRVIANRDDWQFALELYHGDIDTGDLGQLADET